MDRSQAARIFSLWLYNRHIKKGVGHIQDVILLSRRRIGIFYRVAAHLRLYRQATVAARVQKICFLHILQCLKFYGRLSRRLVNLTKFSVVKEFRTFTCISLI